jgi:hypothetical protein
MSGVFAENRAANNVEKDGRARQAIGEI